MRLSPSIAILRTQTDERLVELAREGSEPAFAAIVERYRRQIVRATRRVLPEARAEDAAQQVFMSAWLALERGDQVVNLRSWLLMIARNTALNALRVQGYDYAELQDSLRTSEAPQHELERRDVMRQTLAGLAALPERQREALLRSAVEGASHADIAREMGLTEGATRQLVLRARMTLRAAATAMTPWPLVSWLSSRGGGDSEAVHRLIEVAIAGGGAGTTALLAKAGVVAVVAGGAVAGPGALVQSSEDTASAAKPAAAGKPAPAKHAAARSRAVAVSASTPVRWAGDVARTRDVGPTPATSERRAAERDEDRSRRKLSDEEDEERSERPGRREHGDDDEGSPSRTGSGRSGSSDDEDLDEITSGHSGSGGSDDDEPDESGSSGKLEDDDDRSGSNSAKVPAPLAIAPAPVSDPALTPPAEEPNTVDDSSGRVADTSQQPLGN